MPDAAETLAARSLLSAAAVRERANQLLEHALAGRLDHFTVDLGRLEACADEVLAPIEQNYPDLDIPFHARWRHFSAGDIDRWGAVASAVEWEDAPALARAAFDLAIVSVLLDAGAGPDWRYAEGRTGETYNVGGWNEMTNLDVVHTLCDLLDSARPRAQGSYRDQIAYVKDRPGHDRRYAIDARKLERELGWKPAETFATGLAKTVFWYLDNQAWSDEVASGEYRKWVETNYAERV